MFISRKKLAQMLEDQKVTLYEERRRIDTEHNQWEKIHELRERVKKLEELAGVRKPKSHCPYATEED